MSVYKDILTELARNCYGGYTEQWEDELSDEGKFTAWLESGAEAVFRETSVKLKDEPFSIVEYRVRHRLLMSILKKGVEYVEEQGDIASLFNSNDNP